MVEKVTIIASIFVLGAIFCIISLIFIIKKPKSILWAAVFAISFITPVVTLYYGMFKVASVASKVDEVLGDAVIAALLVDSRTHLIDSTPQNEQVKLLQSYTQKDSVPKSFYTYFRFRDSYRMPLVYPYSINCVDMLNHGQIYDERNVADIFSNNDNAIQLQINGITHIAYDKYILLAKTEDIFNNDEIGYLIFNFNNGEVENFDSNEDMFNKAYNTNYTGADTLMSLEQYDDLFR